MKSKTFQAFFAFILALLVIVTINLLTNRVDQLGGHSWDFLYYKDMVQNGFIGNNHLVVPYAYRFLTPLTVSLIMAFTHMDLTKAFKALSVICMLAQLVGVYLFSRQLKFRFGTSIVLMLVVAFSIFNVKFLLFDPYRPDPLAYPLLLFALIFFLRRQYFGCILISLVGLLVREALIIPILICIYYIAKEWWQNRSRPKPLLQLGVILAFTAVTIILPRAIIPVHGTQQILDPINDPKFFKVLFGSWIDLKKWFNLIFNVCAYFLPILLVFTPARLIESLRRISALQPALYIYLTGAFFIIMYGGTDMMRYVTYLFIPQVIILGNILEQDVSYLESGFMLLATFLFNKILFQFPVWDFYAYLDFHGGYDSRITSASFTRWKEWLAYIGMAWIWRKSVTGLGTSAQHDLFPGTPHRL